MDRFIGEISLEWLSIDYNLKSNMDRFIAAPADWIERLQLTFKIQYG